MAGAADPRRRLRVCLDLNVWYAAELARTLGRRDTTPLRLMHACRERRFDLIVSRAMLDRMIAVFRRPPLAFSFDLAVERAEQVGTLADLPNLLIVGGGVIPLADVEDGGVLEAALAGRADRLATYNLDDFRPAATTGKDGRLMVRDVHVVHPADLAEELRV